MTARQQAFRVDRQRHRRLQAFGQRAQFGGCLDGPATGQDQRAPRASEQAGGLVEGGRRASWLRGKHRRAGCHAANRRDDHVERNFDVNRSWPLAPEHRERAGQHLRQFVRIQQRVGERGEPGEYAVLRRQFVQAASAVAQLVRGVDAGDHEHRDRIGVGLRHRGRDIRHARPGDDEAHAGLAGNARITVGHETCALLVAWRDVTQCRRREPTIQLDGMDAGNAEHQFDAVVFKQPHECFAAGLRGGRPELAVFARVGEERGVFRRVHATPVTLIDCWDMLGSGVCVLDAFLFRSTWPATDEFACSSCPVLMAAIDNNTFRETRISICYSVGYMI